MKIEDGYIAITLVIVTIVIGSATRSAGPPGVDLKSAPRVLVEPAGQWVQWIDKDCKPIGRAVFVADRTDPYVKGRTPENLGSIITGPVDAVGASGVNAEGQPQWFVPEQSPRVRVSGEFDAWQERCTGEPKLLRKQPSGDDIYSPLSRL